MEILLFMVLVGMPLISWLYHRNDNTFLILDENTKTKIIDTTDVFSYLKGIPYLGTSALPSSTILVKRNNHVVYLK